ncbi:DNA_circ_N domain-containing protein [Burkholderia diffusa]|uniref:DNA circularization protein n=1 Tax=Burkholderia diffusa TaxID=488732 RepID=UPI001CACF99A|nr:DNA circularization N-terminal domain-containing protein [Burkholderia diffusa]CAG9250184.1 DNA_circ_N domain-containing protein [Burkholderia diffusa]
MNTIAMPFFDELQPASWRGVPFAIRRGSLKVGRRVAVHEYPYRDDVWVEDLGRAGRRISLTGFLLQDAAYGGGDVIAQRAAMIAACETEDENDGELVHPSLGRITVSLLDFECEETELGRTFELQFSFIQSGQQQFPSLAIATQAQTALSVVAAFAASAQDFVNGILSMMQTPALVGEVMRTVQAFVVDAQAIAQRATSLVALVATLKGEYGRFVGQFTASVKISSMTIAQLIGAGAHAREAVRENGVALAAAASIANYTGVTAAAQCLVTEIRDANPDPHQAVQALLALQQGTLAQVRATPTLTAANGLVATLFRRCAVVALASGTTAYALTSYDDAQTLRATVRDALDTEITAAADARDDMTYAALLALETTVMQDLTTRGESLATMRSVSMNQSMPLIVLAYRFYQDVSKYGPLLQQVDPINPAFSPVTFRASLA